MLLHRLTLWPHGRIEAERLDLDKVDAGAVALFEPLFNNGFVFNSPVPCDLGDGQVKGTGTVTGQALRPCSLNGTIFLCSAIAAGIAQAGDEEIFAMYLSSLEQTGIIRDMATKKPDPLAPFRNRCERPLLTSVVIPSLPPEKFD